MEKARTTGSPWRSWTAIALVLVALALVQACGESGKSTGPTSNASLQLKLRRVNGAEVPAACRGTYSVSGPGVSINNASLPDGGKINFQGQVGLTYLISVELTCGQLLVAKQGTGGTLTGGTQVTLQPGGNEATIVLEFSQVLEVKCKSPVNPGEASNCECKVQSPGSANLGWTGANPSGPATATFSNPNPGTYTVSCTVNGIDTKSTTVEVNSPTPTTAPPPPPPPPPPPQPPAPQTGTITVTNSGPYGSITVSFSGPQAIPFVTVPDGGSVTIPGVTPGAYTALNSCDGPPAVPFTVTAGQNTVLPFTSFGCG